MVTKSMEVHSYNFSPPEYGGRRGLPHVHDWPELQSETLAEKEERGGEKRGGQGREEEDNQKLSLNNTVDTVT